jgi:hypothetical protein
VLSSHVLSTSLATDRGCEQGGFHGALTYDEVGGWGAQALAALVKAVWEGRAVASADACHSTGDSPGFAVERCSEDDPETEVDLADLD